MTFLDDVKRILDEAHEEQCQALFGKSAAEVAASVEANRAERLPACREAGRDFKRCAYCVKRSAGHCQSEWSELYPDPCSNCNGTGFVERPALCQVCRGVGRV